MTKEELIELRNITNELVKLVLPSEVEGESINWADLSCVEAAWKRTDTGEEYPIVSISEASPNSNQFCNWVGKQLQEKFGYVGIQVVTEW